MVAKRVYPYVILDLEISTYYIKSSCAWVLIIIGLVCALAGNQMSVSSYHHQGQRCRGGGDCPPSIFEMLLNISHAACVLQRIKKQKNYKKRATHNLTIFTETGTMSQQSQDSWIVFLIWVNSSTGAAEAELYIMRSTCVSIISCWQSFSSCDFDKLPHLMDPTYWFGCGHPLRIQHIRPLRM